ncbi:MAG: hypothetical protein R3E08_04050 [Thiotrichaceae bacterium]
MYSILKMLNELVGWKNSEFQEVVEKASMILDQDERKRLYRQAEQLLVQEDVVIVLTYVQYRALPVKPRLKGGITWRWGDSKSVIGL